MTAAIEEVCCDEQRKTDYKGYHITKVSIQVCEFSKKKRIMHAPIKSLTPTQGS